MTVTVSSGGETSVALDDAERARRARQLAALWRAVQARGEELRVASEEAFAGGDLLAVLNLMTTARQEYEAVRDAVLVEAKRQGASWQDIGNALGLPRQVVWKKYSAQI